MKLRSELKGIPANNYYEVADLINRLLCFQIEFRSHFGVNINKWFEPKIPTDRLHPQFKWLLDLGYQSERELIESWIDEFPIKDGLDKTINEFQSTFRSTFWELYLNQVITSSGWKVDPECGSPDFIIQKDSKTYSVEAVVANFAKKSKTEDERTVEDIYYDNDIYQIISASVLRTLNAITYKSAKFFASYSTNERVASNPYIIALADYGQINYGQSSFYSMMAVLYNAAYDPEDKLELKILCEDNFGNEYKYIDSIKKENGTELPLGLFSNDEHKHISAILFTCTLTLGKLTSLKASHSFDRFVYLEREHIKQIRYSGSKSDESLCDGLFLFLNPYADHPIDQQSFQGKGLTVITGDLENEYEFQIVCEGSSPLTRRKVGMRGEEVSLLKDLGDFTFYPVAKET